MGSLTIRIHSVPCCAVLGKDAEFILIDLLRLDDVIDGECEPAALVSRRPV